MFKKVQFNKISDQVLFLKYKKGNAYYYFSGGNARKMKHLLSGDEFPLNQAKMIPAQWEDIPRTYQLDAMALNPDIRKLFGERGHHEADTGHQFKKFAPFEKNSKFRLLGGAEEPYGHRRHYTPSSPHTTSSMPVSQVHSMMGALGIDSEEMLRSMAEEIANDITEEPARGYTVQDVAESARLTAEADQVLEVEESQQEFADLFNDAGITSIF